MFVTLNATKGTNFPPTHYFKFCRVDNCIMFVDLGAMCLENYPPY
jgi:hypothetical protein